MEQNRTPSQFRKRLWRQANIRLLPSAILSIVGANLSSAYGHVRYGNIDQKFIALVGVLVFIVFATIFVQVLTSTIRRIISSHLLSNGRAAAVQFGMRVFGYIAILVTTLDLLGIPVGKLLLGGAAIGIILGVAAQQALGNFFASIVLIISHPFSVGDHVTITSGAMGGEYEGEIKDIGLTHTRLEKKNGENVLLPNSTVLSGAAITAAKV